MWKCGRCGGENEDDYKFCDNCGLAKAEAIGELASQTDVKAAFLTLTGDEAEQNARFPRSSSSVRDLGSRIFRAAFNYSGEPHVFRMDKQGKAEQAGSGNTRDKSAIHGSALLGHSADLQSQPSVEVAAARRASTESESLAREIKEGNLGGFVGSGTSINGETTFKAMLRIDGHLTGHVHSADGTLMVGAGGLVEADIKVGIAIINGRVQGDITASKRVELGRAATVIGNIDTAALVIEQGAIFEGSCRMTAHQAASEQPAEQSLVSGTPSVEANALVVAD